MGKPLTILHVEDISHESPSRIAFRVSNANASCSGNWVCAQDVATTAKVAYGPVGETITRFATQEGAELIVMGLDMEEKDQELQRSDVLRRFVLMAAPCPVSFFCRRSIAAKTSLMQIQRLTVARVRQWKAWKHRRPAPLQRDRKM